jgi:DnaJ-class molecular chaperone
MGARARPVADLYAILGVAPTSSLPDIKRAYRRLAHQYHPDVSTAVGAEERFKEIGAAYEVLRDTALREAYDRSRPPTPGPPAEPPAPAARPTRPAPDEASEPAPQTGPSTKNPDIRVKVELTYAEAIGGASKRVGFRRRVVCEGCHGRRRIDKCRYCFDLGWREVLDHYTWQVPPGSVPGDSTRIPGIGDQLGDKPGDLILSVLLRKQAGLTRNGVDFATSKRVSPSVFKTGAEVTVEGPSGPLRVVIPPNARPGQVLRLAGVGLPYAGGRGSLFVTLREIRT